VHQLVLGVPVVGVHRHEAGLEAGEQALEVLGAVVEVLGDLVLLAGPGIEEGAGDSVGALVGLSPGDDAIALLGEGGAGQVVGGSLPDLGNGPAGPVVSPEGEGTDRGLRCGSRDPAGTARAACACRACQWAGAAARRGTRSASGTCSRRCARG